MAIFLLKQQKIAQKPFWKGSRGEWYLVVQTVLFSLLMFGPHTCRWLTTWESPFGWISSLGGGVLFVAGVLLASAGALHLGNNLTPLPLPKENSTLIITGAYRFVRHPIYSGMIFMAFGWALWLNSWLTICYALLLFALFDMKSGFEERLLELKFPEYAAYRNRTRKLLPFVC